MKKEQLRLKKLTLNRETIVGLSNAALAKVPGAMMPPGDSVEYGGCTMTIGWAC